MSQYVKLGTQCEPRTMSAITSNDKYILPFSNVYYNKWTPMMYYPGMEQIYGEEPSGDEPEHIKAFETKESNTVPQHTHNLSNNQSVGQNIKTCQMCKTSS